jgi:hypothetical protein
VLYDGMVIRFLMPSWGFLLAAVIGAALAGALMSAIARRFWERDLKTRLPEEAQRQVAEARFGRQEAEGAESRALAEADRWREAYFSLLAKVKAARVQQAKATEALAIGIDGAHTRRRNGRAKDGTD